MIWEFLVERADAADRDVLLLAAADVWAVSDELSAIPTSRGESAVPFTISAGSRRPAIRPVWRPSRHRPAHASLFAMTISHSPSCSRARPSSRTLS
jgi:hypothetical protein